MHLVRVLMVALAALLPSLVVGACGSDASGPAADAAADGGASALPLGSPCSSAEQCQNGACVAVAEGRSVCTGGCTVREQCPAAPNWACVRATAIEVDICACESDSPEEICGDGIDNDCDGITDCPPPTVGPERDASVPDVMPPTPDAGPMMSIDEVDPCTLDPGLCPACIADDECDDGNPCTRDACRLGGCTHVPFDKLCAIGEVCQLGKGCVPGTACAADADCADANACTRSEYCDLATKVCRFSMLDEDGDGRYPAVCGGDDCDDADATVFVGAIDYCDGKDNDCDGRVDPASAALVCGDNRVCFEGACLCDGEHSPCAGRCVDPAIYLTDDTNCGRCGNDCGGGMRCQAGECVGIDECAETEGLCGSHATCMDTQRGYTCTCDDGYDDFGATACEDIDECARNLDTCDSAPEACNNTEGAFECVCPPGYSGDGVGADGCVDKDECVLGLDMCAATELCVNNVGAYGCSRRAVDVLASVNFTCARLDDGSVKCFGYNAQGQLAQGDLLARGLTPGELGDNLIPVDLGEGRRASAIAAGDFHVCALLDDGRVKCWGENGSGQLGVGNGQATVDAGTGEMFPAVPLGTGRTATAIAAGGSTTCAILDDTTLKCWGENASGQLGQGDRILRGTAASQMGDALLAIDLGTGRKARQVSVGATHVCAVLDDNTLKCWGGNNYGQLGVGSTLVLGDAPGEMGDALPVVNLGPQTPKRVLASGYSTCAHLSDDTLKCWGANGSGQLGQGDTLHRGATVSSTPDQIPVINVGSGHSVKEVALGPVSVCARLEDDGVKCWGANSWGQLGHGSRNAIGNQSTDMGDALPALQFGALGQPVQVSVGNNHTCARFTDGGVRCWGMGQNGQLGTGAGGAVKGTPQGVLSDAIAPVDLGR